MQNQISNFSILDLRVLVIFVLTQIAPIVAEFSRQLEKYKSENIFLFNIFVEKSFKSQEIKLNFFLNE